MKEKIKMGLLSLTVVALSIGSAFADVEAPGGGGSSAKCQPPTTNTCIVIKNSKGEVTYTEKGVLKVGF